MSYTPIIIWDVDDVLNCFMESWLKHWNSKNDEDVDFFEITKNPPNKILGVSDNAYFNSLDNFRNSDKGKTVKVNSSIKNWFLINGDKFNHIACTARPISTMANQSHWIYYHYGKWIRTIHASNAQRNDNKIDNGVTKAEFIKWIKKPILFIDDSEENINSVSKIGADTLLFPQPWNKVNLSIDDFLNKLNTKLNI